MNATKYYLADGSVQQLECLNIAGYMGATGVPVRMRRTATDGRSEEWTCGSERNTIPNETTTTTPTETTATISTEPIATTLTKTTMTTTTGCLDRVLMCDRKLCNNPFNRHDGPVLCSCFWLTVPDGEWLTPNHEESIALLSRRDADADVVLGSESKTVVFGMVDPHWPMLLVSENSIHAPYGHHIVCRASVRFVDIQIEPCWANEPCICYAKDAPRTIEDDDGDTVKNVKTLNSMVSCAVDRPNAKSREEARAAISETVRSNAVAEVATIGGEKWHTVITDAVRDLRAVRGGDRIARCGELMCALSRASIKSGVRLTAARMEVDGIRELGVGDRCWTTSSTSDNVDIVLDDDSRSTWWCLLWCSEIRVRVDDRVADAGTPEILRVPGTTDEVVTRFSGSIELDCRCSPHDQTIFIATGSDAFYFNGVRLVSETGAMVVSRNRAWAV